MLILRGIEFHQRLAALGLAAFFLGNLFTYLREPIKITPFAHTETIQRFVLGNNNPILGRCSLHQREDGRNMPVVSHFNILFLNTKYS